MTRTRGRTQIERHLAVMSPALPEAPVERWYPDPARVQNWPFVIPVIGLGRIIGRQGLDVDSGRLIEFSMSAQVMHGVHWSEVARVDTAHAEVHLHLRSQKGLYIERRVLSIITGPQDVDEGWEVGEHLLFADWEHHESRWRSGTPGPGAGRGCQ